MRKIAWGLGFFWMVALVAVGVWHGFMQLFFGWGGILFQSGFADIWILAIFALPGYLLWKWGSGAAEVDKGDNA